MTDRYEPVSRRHIDILPHNMNLNLNPGLANRDQAPWLVGGPMIKTIEKTFDNELSKLKNEMKS